LIPKELSGESRPVNRRPGKERGSMEGIDL
jgi:hypothetical protein